MRMVSGTPFGVDKKTLLMIYMSLIRSKIDYGCQAYMSAMFLQREIKLAIPHQTNTNPINTHLLSKHHMQP